MKRFCLIDLLNSLARLIKAKGQGPSFTTRQRLVPLLTKRTTLPGNLGRAVCQGSVCVVNKPILVHLDSNQTGFQWLVLSTCLGAGQA